MPEARIYIPPQELNEIIEIRENRAIHKIKNVLRLKRDNTIAVFDGKGKEYLYNLIEIKRNLISLKKNKLCREQECPKKRITLGFPLTKEEKVDFILQKATELGIFTFLPFVSDRSISAQPSPSKVERWKKIIIEASRQCERLWLPTLSAVSSFSELCKTTFSFKFAASIRGEKLEDFINPNISEALIAIGPEGDFSPEEYESLIKNNFRLVRICDNILRVETAAIFAAGLLGYYLNK
jgi:16S rRNA (uracil1498-N3)-methyltransferase